MGFICSKSIDLELATIESELEGLRTCLVFLLKQLPSEDLLNFCIADTDIHEICKLNSELRQSCIRAAVKKYHDEKYVNPEVYNRTADFMVILDHFVQIQNADDLRNMDEDSSDDEETSAPVSCFAFRKSFRRDDENHDEDREGDAASTSGTSDTASTASTNRA